MHAGRVWLGRSEETFYKATQNKFNAGSCVPRIYANIIANTVMKKFILTYARKIEEEKTLKYEKTK
jgi:hypothetical protein